MNIEFEFKCKCDKTLTASPAYEQFSCGNCGRVWVRETQTRDDGVWSRVKLVSEPALIPGWASISGAPRGEYLLLLCPSQTVNLSHVVLVGKYSNYHDRWDDENNDALADGGYVPIAYRPLSDLGLSNRRLN